MTYPRLACCNFLSDVRELKAFALDNGFDGIDWTFTPETLPRNAGEVFGMVETISSLRPLDVRYHCFFERTDVGDANQAEADYALSVFSRAVEVVFALGGCCLTVHVGLGRDTTAELSWDRTLEGLTKLARFARASGVRVCLENLGWGWTSRPRLFEKLIRKSECWATLDIGHAQVSSSIRSRVYDVADFVLPHRTRFLNAHVYHEEHDGLGHVPPGNLCDLQDRLALLRTLPLCDWWVLELREEKPLLETLAVVREFLRQ
jgi:sugar phosphate isomerase/epimerase